MVITLNIIWRGAYYMELLRKHAFKICLLLILIASGILCVFTTVNYSGNTNQNQMNLEQRGFNGISNGQNTPTDNVNRPSKNQFTQSDQQQPGGGFQNGFSRGGNTTTSNKYAPIIATYSAAFLGLFAVGYYFIRNKKIKISVNNEKMLIVSLLCVGLFIRIIMGLNVEGFSSDLNLFKNWALSAANNLSAVYSNARSADYPPLYMYVLFIVGKLINLSAISKYSILILKLPSIIADIISAYVLYKLAKKKLSVEWSMLISALYIFNPAIFINSALWGQVDSFFALIIILAVYLLAEQKIGFSAALFSAAVLMKPQGIIFLPVIFFELVRQKNLKNFMKAVGIALGVAILIILPFSINKDISWIFNLYSNTVSEYPYASVNAFNFFSLIGANYVKDTTTLFILSYHSWGMIFIVAITAFSWFIYIKGKNSTIAPSAALVQIAGVFTFSVGMHERYLFPAAALAMLAFIYLKDKRFLILFAGYSTTIFINTYSILFGASNGMNSTNYGPELVLTSLLNVILFGYLTKILYDIAVKKKVNILSF